MHRLPLAGVALGLAMTLPALAQEPAERATAPVPSSVPSDATSIDGVIDAWYGAISGPVGAPRDWARDAALYLPGAVFVIAGEGATPRSVTPSQFAEESDEFLVRSGFVEREIHRSTRQFGRVAHVWSTYEWETADGQTGRGINSIHLWHDGVRWWITHATWEGETPDRPIPAEFLPR